MKGHRSIPERNAQLSTDGFRHHPGTQVRGCGLDAALRKQEGAGLLSSCLVLFYHLVGPDSFARDINIMSSRLSASLERMLAMQTVRANGSEQDASFLRERRELFIVEVGNLYSYSFVNGLSLPIPDAGIQE